MKTYSIYELKLEDEDLEMLMTMGVVVSGTFLDLLALKKSLEEHPKIRVVYRTISTAHLRIVKRDDWEAFEAWKREKQKV